MFKSIKIKNLRAITELEIDNLGQVNLLVGQNNCGKTTILEALFFLIGATNPQLLVNVNGFRGLPLVSNELWATYFHNLEVKSNITISGVVRKTSEQQELTISANVPGATTVEPGLSNVSTGVEAGDSIPSFLPDGLELMSISSKDPNAKTVTKIFLKGEQLIAEGTKEHFPRGIFVAATTIFHWKARFSTVQRRKLLPEVVSLLKEIEPGLLDLRITVPELLEADVGLPGLIPANLMGGGTAKLLSIALAVLDSRDGIVLIDEIENGLCYSAQRKLWEAILKWAQDLNVQVFATTHSWECIRAFNACAESTLFGSEAKLYRIERKDEKFRAVEYTKDTLAESLDSNWEVR